MRKLILATFLSSLVHVGVAQDSTPVQKIEQEFTRFVKTGKLEGRFETAIVSYKNADGKTVDLIGAVHIADAPYYTKLQKIFGNYDAVLYELIAPANNLLPSRGKKSSGFISIIQRGLKNILELDFQLDGIDYRMKNFVHADLTAEEFQRVQNDRGESMLTMMLKLMGEAASQARKNPGSEPPMAALVAALFSNNRAHQLKYIFAKQLDKIEQMLAGGGKGESIIIHERNKKCMRVLEEQLRTDKKSLGVFYGAAHLPDLEMRLKKLGFERTAEKWLVAWDLENKNKPATEPVRPTKKL